MTTVAYKDGIIACDSCWSLNNAVDTLSTKIFRLKSGGLLGHSGGNDGRVFMDLLNDVKTYKQLPTYATMLSIRASFLGVLILPNKEIYKIATTFTAPEQWTEEHSPDIGVWQIDDTMTAIGTGSDVALGAMEAGATAVKAVRIACKRDLNSRPPVKSLSLLS